MGEAVTKNGGGERDTMPYRIAQYRLLLVKDGPAITTTWDRQVRQAKDVADFMAPLAANADRERFWCLMLNGKNTVIGLNLVSIGSLTATVVHPREFLKALILGNAAATIVVHNHPSGSPAPSAEDIALTRRLREVGDLVGIRLLDHIILGHDGSYCSLADDGLISGEVSWK